MYSVTLENVGKTYRNGVRGLRDINLHINAGEFVFLSGKSGSGKSTLINIITKEIEPTEGKVYFGNVDITDMQRKEIPYFRRKLGIIKGDGLLLDKRTVYKNIELALLASGKSARGMKETILTALGMVGLRDKANAKPFELSGGERSKIAFVRALVNNPSILIADEPTLGLDNDAAYDIMRFLGEINRLNITTIIATHEKDLVNIMKKRVITLYDGHIIGDVKHGKYGDLV